jgi:hypothetical protein
LPEQSKTKLRLGKFKDDAEKADLERLVICADSIDNILIPEKLSTVPWIDLCKSVEALEKRSYKIPIDASRSLARRMALDYFRANKFDDWIRTLWPSSCKGEAPTTPKAASKDRDGSATDGSCSESSGGSDDEDAKEALDYVITPESFDMSEPLMSCLLPKDKEENGPALLQSQVFEGLFSNFFLAIVRSADLSVLCKVVAAFMTHIRRSPADGCVEKLMEPAVQFYSCLCSLIFPQPYKHGCNAEDVYAFVQVGEKKKKQPAHPLTPYKKTQHFIEEVLVGQHFQSLVAEWKKFVGAESGKGVEMNEMQQQLTGLFDKAKITHIQAAADNNAGDSQEHEAAARKDLLDLLAVYAESIAVFRQKLRPGATRDLDFLVLSIVMWAMPETSRAGTVAELESFRALAKIIPDDKLHARANDLIMQLAEASHVGRLSNALKADLSDRASVVELLAAAKQTENTENIDAEVKDLMLPALDQVLESLLVAVRSGNVTLESVAPWRELLGTCWCKDKTLQEALSVQPAKLKTSIQNFLVVVGRIASARSKIKAYSEARQSGDATSKRLSLIALQRDTTELQQVYEQPAAVEVPPFSVSMKRVLALAKVLVEGSGDFDEAGKEKMVGMIAILGHAACSHVAEAKKELSDKLTALQSIADGGTSAGRPWHDGLAKECTLIDVQEVAKETLLKCDVDDLDNKAIALKMVIIIVPTPGAHGSRIC